MSQSNTFQSSKDIWNTVSQYFNTHKQDDDIEAGAADNILIAWPVILKFIEDHIENSQKCKALDFGCGTGSFCLKLSSLGFDTTGIDYSEEMIKIAKHNCNSTIQLYVGDTTNVRKIAKKEGTFDFIVSIMTLQFIENIDTALQDLSQSLSKGGYFCFAVFNPDWVHACREKNILFHTLSNAKSIDKQIMDLDDSRKIMVFNRSSQHYDDILSTLGLKKILEAYPPFTSQFIETYKLVEPTDISEYMILGYKNEQ